MNSTPYTGKVSGMKTSPWLASEDLLGVGPAKVKIAAVVQNKDVEMEGGRKEACLFSLAFSGIPKQMILNATNRRTLSSAFGADTKAWIGQDIELYVQDGIRKPGKGGGTTTGLRITAKPNPDLAKGKTKGVVSPFAAFPDAEPPKESVPLESMPDAAWGDEKELGS